MAPAQDWANASTLEESGTSMPDSSSPAMFLSPETRGLEKDIGNDKPDSTMKPKRPNWYSDSSEEIDVLDYVSGVAPCRVERDKSNANRLPNFDI